MRLLSLSLMLLAIMAIGGGNDSRTWKDATGKYSVEAELVSVDAMSVVLRTNQGKEITIPIQKLSETDREFIAERNRKQEDAPESSPRPTRTAVKEKPAELQELRELASRFYNDLRNKEREDAGSMLTEAGQKLVEEKKSVLTYLPIPDKGNASIKVGKPKIESDQAIVPVSVRFDGEFQRTTLQLRRESEGWKVFAVVAKVGDQENSIQFEMGFEPNKKASAGSPLRELIGQPVSISGVTLDGKPVSLADYKGKVVLVDFWATWCGPCRAEIPNILENYKKYNAMGFEVMAISVDKNLDDLRAFVIQESPPWAVLADKHPMNGRSMAATFGISGIPAFLLIGKDGKVIDVDCRGPKLGESLEQAFRR